MNIQYISTIQINQMIEALVECIRQSGKKFEQVVGIEHGGLFISKPVAKLLELPHDSVHISCYNDTEKREIPLVEGWYNSDLPTLIIDDLIDGGTTIKLFKERFIFKPTDAIGVLFWNKYSSQKPDFYVDEKPEAWLEFYWEVNRED